MRYGVAYYPEHKSPEDLKHDYYLLEASGINTVRIGEFAWNRMEPREGEFDFSWMVDAVNHLGEMGIETIICTPTACPPVWMVREHPEMQYVDNRGVVRPFGGRRHYCYNSEAYRKYCVRVAEKLVEAFRVNPYVCGVQIDNEPAQEGTGRCHCEACQKKFRAYLQQKYGSIENLNHRCGTIFWSQEYTSFEEITIPVNSIEPGTQSAINAYYENPSIRMDYEHFCSQSQTEFQDLQADAIRPILDVPIMTNATGTATNSIDYYESTKNLDYYAFDYYPNLRYAGIDPFPYAFARGIKGGKGFWVPEFVSGGGHCLNGHGRKQSPPGALKQATVHALANGAEMLLHFQFRTFPFGAEQLNYAIVDMDGRAGRRYFEMSETAKLLPKLAAVEQAHFPGEVAVCVDYDSHWALGMKPVNDSQFHYLDYCSRMYRLLSEIGITADVVSMKEADYAQYRMIIIPAGIVMSRPVQDKIADFVEHGGIVMATFLTSVKNPDNVGVTDVLPAGLTDVFGCSVDEVEPVTDNVSALKVLLPHSGREIVCRDGVWSELLGGGAETIGAYTDGYKEGSRVITMNPYGDGKAYYVGTDLPDGAYKEFLTDLMQEAGIGQSDLHSNDKLQVITREDEQHLYRMVFWFGEEPHSLQIPAGYTDLLTGETVEGIVRMEPCGMLLLQKRK